MKDHSIHPSDIYIWERMFASDNVYNAGNREGRCFHTCKQWHFNIAVAMPIGYFDVLV